MSVLAKIEVLINGKVFHGFQSVSLTENLYGIDSFEIECRYDAIEKADEFLIHNSQHYLGAAIEIKTQVPVKDERGKESVSTGINFCGFITAVHSSRGNMSANDRVIISGGSSELKLNRKPTNRAFLDKTLDEIVKEVLKDYDLKSEVTSRYSGTIPYVVQYEESDLEFLKRLSVRYGEWFFFNRDRIIFGEIPVVTRNLTLGLNLQDFSYQLKVSPVKFSLFALDPIKPEKYSYQSGNKKVEGNLSDYGLHALNTSKKIFSSEGRDLYEHLNVVDTDYQKGLDFVGEIEETADAVNLTDVTGVSVNGFISAGNYVNVNYLMANQVRFPYGRYLITSVHHQFDNTLNYLNRFTAIPDKISIPENTNPYFVRTSSSQLGIVADNKDPEKLGRIRITFIWMEKSSIMTPWVRVVTPFVHKESGIYFVPPVNARVLVGFEDGDVERPYCLGCLTDDQFHPDPAWVGNTSEKDAKIHAIRTPSGQTIEFHDDNGKEKIHIYNADKNNEIVLDSANSELQIRSSGKITIEAEDILIKAGSGISIEAGNKLEQKATDVNTDAKSMAKTNAVNVEIKASASLKTEGTASAEITSSGVTTMKGSLVKIN